MSLFKISGSISIFKQLYQVHQYFEKYINIYKEKYINIENKYIDIRKVYQVNQYLKEVYRYL